MAETFTIKGYDGTAWSISISETDRLGFFGVDFGTAISLGEFQDSTHLTNTSMSTDLCATNHIRNCKYTSPLTVKLGSSDSVTLSTESVGQNDCTTLWTYSDSEMNTSLSSIKFFAYNGVSPSIAPTGVVVCAFERTSSAINVDRASDTPSAGGSWNNELGIGGLANALLLSDQSSSSTHNFYIGISISPTSKGLKSGVRLRLEFDVQ